jgi:hypothetical protein
MLASVAFPDRRRMRRAQELEKEQVQQAVASRSLPQFGPGDSLQLKLVRGLPRMAHSVSVSGCRRSCRSIRWMLVSQSWSW